MVDIGVIYFFLNFYWYKTREKQDNCKNLLRMDKKQIFIFNIGHPGAVNIREKKTTVSQSQTPTRSQKIKIP